MSDEQFTGDSGIFTPGMLNIAGSVYKSAFDPIKQYVENGMDAGATRIVIAFFPGKIVISDNGHGMNKLMRPEDRLLMDQYLKELRLGGELIKKLQKELGKKPTWRDIRDKIPEVSRKTLQWMMEFAGMSAKGYTPGGSTYGLQGIGAIAFRQIADSAAWYTKPSEELANKYWGHKIRPADQPVYKLTPPSKEDLEVNIRRYHINETAGAPLLDAFGSTVLSGTVVEITQLKEGIETALRPGDVVRELSEIFGERIFTTKVEIIVVDKITEEGRKSPKGREMRVQPVMYTGIPIIRDRTLQMPDGTPFNVDIRKGTTGSPSHVLRVYRGDQPRCPLTEVRREFRREPWTELVGKVEFPIYPNEAEHWDSTKQIPKPSAVLAKWIPKILALEPEIIEELKGIEERARQRQTAKLADMVAQTMLRVIAERPEFADMAFGSREEPRPKSKKPGKKTYVSDQIRAKVMSEHNHGVANVEVRLYRLAGTKIEKKIADGKTGEGGNYSFGRASNLPPGRYAIWMTTPEGMVCEGSNDHRFPVPPGFNAVFKLITGTAQPPAKRLRLLVVIAADGNIDRPFTNLLNVGQLHINSEAPDFKQAVEGEDYEQQMQLIALFASLAVAEFRAGKNTPLYDPMKKDLYFLQLQPTMLKEARDLFRSRRKEIAQRRGS